LRPLHAAPRVTLSLSYSSCCHASAPKWRIHGKQSYESLRQKSTSAKVLDIRALIDRINRARDARAARRFKARLMAL
jgi:hypothetical protein